MRRQVIDEHTHTLSVWDGNSELLCEAQEQLGIEM